MDAHADLARYHAGLVEELRHLVSAWVSFLRDNWRAHTALGLPAPRSNYPLPHGFMFTPDCRISDTIEWIREYNDGGERQQIRHRYSVAFGFWGHANVARSAVSWCIASGNNLLARFDVPCAILGDPAVDIGPELVFTGILASLARAERVELAFHLHEDVVQGASPAAYYVQEYGLYAPHAELVRRVGVRLAQPCRAATLCDVYVRGDTLVRCDAHVPFPGPALCHRHRLQLASMQADPNGACAARP
ncbi:hypothetical protein B0H15DRAFT_954105 [Mycena belliarum]|uniref:Uncharacterized protein n=1 Tax=Mycena belliarum TaxID=1033014 RepID=A0AAD6TXX4_9AGAR|nr:hypothetical protein B0H15DRAFT_954105 [Mycena belliae]